MKTVAVIGAGGFVGSQIVDAINNSNQYQVIPIFRSSSDVEEAFDRADIIVHSANPAGRYQAENYSELDFKETVEKTAKFFELSKNRKFVLISSLSCRTQLYTAYGRHRRACELIVLTGDSLVIRLGPMFGGGRKKDMLHDILAGREVYVDRETRYAYVDVAWVGNQIVNMLEGKTGIQEIGARNSIRLGDISSFFNSNSKFSGRVENQIPENFQNGPDANDVYTYAQKEQNNATG